MYRNQQQILQSLVSHSCLRRLHRLHSLDDPQRQWLLGVIDLICTCCVGHYADVQAVAQGLVPLPLLIKLLGDFQHLQRLTERAPLLRCLSEVWWAFAWVNTGVGEGEVKWLAETKHWWPLWWEVMKKVQQQIAEFMGLPPHDQLLDHCHYFLRSVAPCLAGFFALCCDTNLNDLLDGRCLGTAHAIAAGLVVIANQCTVPTSEDVGYMEVFLETMARVLTGFGDELGDLTICAINDEEEGRPSPADELGARGVVRGHVLQVPHVSGRRVFAVFPCVPNSLRSVGRLTARSLFGSVTRHGSPMKRRSSAANGKWSYVNRRRGLANCCELAGVQCFAE